MYERGLVNQVPRLFSTLNNLIFLNRHHLSRLLIHMNHFHAFHVAASALGIYLNLTELIVVTAPRDTYEMPRWPERRLRMQRLFLKGWRFSHTELHDLLNLCPDLRCLGLSPRDMDRHDAALDTVYRCCPRLEWLAYHDDATEPFQSWPTYVVKNTGLRDFHVGHRVRSGVDRFVGQFFVRSHSTMQTFVVNPVATQPAHAYFQDTRGVGRSIFGVVSFGKRPVVNANGTRGTRLCSSGSCEDHICVAASFSGGR